ncbi:MAG: hypothetical protein J6J60_00370 [Clostridia bacterium]|nr:hypothetical protein [Clostridia bacterium]
MGINIGDNNKINKSVIGNNNDKEQKENKLLKIVLELLIGIAVGLIVGFCIYKFGWNK